MYNPAYFSMIEHRHWAYRGCAPDLDEPLQAAGDLGLPVSAWSPRTEDAGSEPQRDRLERERAVLAVCAVCPVMEACRNYGLSQTAEGKLYVPEGVLGGMLALDRHRHLIRSRLDAPQETGQAPAVNLALARTPQKAALLRSLAGEWDDELVAYRAGMDQRTARWQRSFLVGLLGLDKETCTRQQLLTVARGLGLLPVGVRIVPDPHPIAAAPNTDGSRQRRVEATAAGQLPLPGFPRLPRTLPARAGTRRARRTGARVLQLVLLPAPGRAPDRAAATVPATPTVPAPVAATPTATTHCLEPAA